MHLTLPVDRNRRLKDYDKRSAGLTMRKSNISKKRNWEGKLKELKELDDTISAQEADLKEIEKALKEKIKALTETVKALKGKPAELTAAKNVSEKY